MELIEQILSQSNLKEAIRRVKINKGTPGVDNKTVDELDGYFNKHQAEIKDSIMKMKYSPQAVRRVYIPKANLRLGWYKRSTGQVVNFMLSPQVLGIRKADRPGLVDPLEYYISRKELQI